MKMMEDVQDMNLSFHNGKHNKKMVSYTYGRMGKEGRKDLKGLTWSERYREEARHVTCVKKQ